MNAVHQHKKTLNFRDIFLFSVAAVLLLDSLATSVASGPTILFWWGLFIVIFLLPLAAITAELGVQYPDQGGVYAWAKRAYGRKMGARVSWYYWVNVALFVPAIFILFSSIFAQLFWPDMSLMGQVITSIILIWLVVFLNIITLEVGKWIPNVGALLKIAIFIIIIVGSIMYANEHGVVTELSFETIIPTSETLNWQCLPVVIYGMLGYELVCTSGDEMKDAKRDIPRAVFASAAIVTAFYVLGTIAILIAFPSAEVSLVDGLVDTFVLFFGGSAMGDAFVMFLGIAALFTFYANGVTWTMGANRAACEAAYDKELPSILGIESKKAGTPVGAAVSLGVIASALVALYGFLATSDEDLFWTLFAFSAVIFILPYIFMVLSFAKLREIETPGSIRNGSGYRVPGSINFVKGIAYLCAIILSIAIVLFVYIPGEGIQWGILIGALTMIGLGEVAIKQAEKR